MTTVDRTFLDRAAARKEAQDTARNGSDGVVAGGGEPPNPPGMEALNARVDGLERGIARIDGRLDGIDTRLRAVETTLASVSGKLDTLNTTIVGKIPSTAQMAVAITSSVSVIAGVLAALGALLHFVFSK